MSTLTKSNKKKKYSEMLANGGNIQTVSSLDFEEESSLDPGQSFKNNEIVAENLESLRRAHS